MCSSDLWTSTCNQVPTTPRRLIFHAWIPLSATLLGFVFGTLMGIGLAVLIVHNRSMDRSLLPWIFASQTIPILAIAPMVVVVLNSVGMTGLIPKALISTYLSFFPVVVGMVKGFRSPDALHLDLMHTYSASASQTFGKLRWPSAIPFLFTSMKVGVAASLVGAIVGELPTGAAGGLGSRLLAGSYYGQTTQIWSALVMTAVMSTSLKVVSMAAVFCASLRRLAMVRRSRVMRTRSSRSARRRGPAGAAGFAAGALAAGIDESAASTSALVARPSLPVGWIADAATPVSSTSLRVAGPDAAMLAATGAGAAAATGAGAGGGGAGRGRASTTQRGRWSRVAGTGCSGGTPGAERGWSNRGWSLRMLLRPPSRTVFASSPIPRALLHARSAATWR